MNRFLDLEARVDRDEDDIDSEEERDIQGKFYVFTYICYLKLYTLEDQFIDDDVQVDDLPSTPHCPHSLNDEDDEEMISQIYARLKPRYHKRYSEDITDVTSAEDLSLPEIAVDDECPLFRVRCRVGSYILLI